MKVMSLDRQALKILGIISTVNKPYYWRMAFSRFICLVTPILFLVPSVAYFLCNFRDVTKATNAFYLICCTVMAAITYFECWLKKPIILSIIYGIQKCVNNSSIEYRPEYEKTESLNKKIVHYFKVFVFCSIFGVVSLPLCIYLIVWISGNDPNDVRILPAALKLPLDVETWPGYILGYILCYLAAYFLSVASSLYVVFISIALYLKAAFDEVRFKLKTINQNFIDFREDFHSKPSISSHGCDTQCQLVNTLKDHLRVLELLKELNSLLARLKYYIFSFGSLILCTGLFQVQQSALDGSQTVFRFVAACSCDISVLFIFCFSGEIIIHAHDISVDVYKLLWYRFDAKSKYIVWLMIARTQKPYYFASYNGINCSLEMFINIIRKAGAILAMLRSI